MRLGKPDAAWVAHLVEVDAHAHRDNDHKGNIPENALCRKSDVETIRVRSTVALLGQCKRPRTT